MSISNLPNVNALFDAIQKPQPSGLTANTNNQQAVSQYQSVSFQQSSQLTIVQKLFGNPEEASSNALHITFKEAIEQLNEQLLADMGLSPDSDEPAPISEEALEEQGGMEYWTPENTAKRIVEGSTAFLSGFQNIHPELEGDALVERFLEVVGGGISQGFEQAKGILGELNVLEEDIETQIDQTYDLVQSGLQQFKTDYLTDIPVQPEVV